MLPDALSGLRMASKNSSKTAVYGALVGNVLVAVTKLGAALWTGSASMMSEAIHSFGDTGNEILLLYGMRRASLRPDDSAALVGILLAAGGTYGASVLDMPVLDGVASILIGVVLGGVSVLLARESKSLLIGERADGRLGESLLRIAGAEQGVESANGVLTTQLAPDQIVAALSIDFEDTLTARDVEAIVQRIEENTRAAHPNVVALFVKPQTDRAFVESMRKRYGLPPAKAISS